MAKSIPTKDADFDVASGIICSTVDARRDDWRLDGEWLDGTLLPARAGWTTAWGNYQDPNTRSPLIVFQKKSARSAFEEVLRPLVSALEVNPRVSSDDLSAMGIVVRSRTRTPAPAPTTFPEATVDVSTPRRITIHFRDTGSSRRAKPVGVHGAEIRWALAETKPALEQLVNSSFDTRTPLILEFADADRGKRLWFALRWENTRSEKGPFGEIASAVIP